MLNEEITASVICDEDSNDAEGNGRQTKATLRDVLQHLDAYARLLQVE